MSIVYVHGVLGCKSWTIKKAECRRIDAFDVVLEKTLESPLDCKEIQPVHSEEDQSWVFIGRTDAEAETSILRSPDAKNWLTGKDPDAGKDWRQEEKGMTENEMVRWHHWLSRHEFEYSRSWWWTGRPGCAAWGRKEWDTTDRLNWTELFSFGWSLCASTKIINLRSK